MYPHRLDTGQAVKASALEYLNNFVPLRLNLTVVICLIKLHLQPQFRSQLSKFISPCLIIPVPFLILFPSQRGTVPPEKMDYEALKEQWSEVEDRDGVRLSWNVFPSTRMVSRRLGDDHSLLTYYLLFLVSRKPRALLSPSAPYTTLSRKSQSHRSSNLSLLHASNHAAPSSTPSGKESQTATVASS